MSEKINRGAAEENSQAPATPEEDNQPASPSSLPGNEASRVRGDAEDRAGTPHTE